MKQRDELKEQIRENIKSLLDKSNSKIAKLEYMQNVLGVEFDYHNNWIRSVVIDMVDSGELVLRLSYED